LASERGDLSDEPGRRQAERSIEGGEPWAHIPDERLASVFLRTQGKNQLLVAATDMNVSLTAELKSQNAAARGRNDRAAGATRGR
jgi:hypothetical protein